MIKLAHVLKIELSNQLQFQEIILWTIVRDLRFGVQTGSGLASFYEHYSFVLFIELTKIEEELLDIDWVNIMHEELNIFTRNEVWKRAKKQNMIGTRWVFKNKQNEDGIVVRNKSRLVAQGYTQVSRIWLWRNICPSCKYGSNKTIVNICMCSWYHVISNGRPECIPQWMSMN